MYSQPITCSGKLWGLFPGVPALVSSFNSQHILPLEVEGWDRTSSHLRGFLNFEYPYSRSIRYSLTARHLYLYCFSPLYSPLSPYYSYCGDFCGFSRFWGSVSNVDILNPKYPTGRCTRWVRLTREIIVNHLWQKESLCAETWAGTWSLIAEQDSMSFLPLNVPLPAAARRCYPVNISHPISPGQQAFCISPAEHPI